MLYSPLDDTAPLLPVLLDLWHRRKIPTRIYRAFFYARGRNIGRMRTVGELRHALKQPGTPHLLDIPHLGRVSIARLHALFIDHPQT